MELYFLRHAIAIDRANPKYKDDAKRPLTAQGEQKMHCCALGMRALGLSFDTILCSPYVRARQTAEIVAQVFKLKSAKINFTNALVSDAPFEILLQEIRTDFPKSKNILLVGHEPHLSQCISSLLTNGNPFSIDLKKGGLCHLSWYPTEERGIAALNWLLTPSQLCLIASSKPKKE